jgi:hypothetical protein
VRRRWSRLPESAKQIIVGSAITVAATMHVWFVAKGVPAMIQWIYGSVIMRLNRARRLISAEGLTETGTFESFVSTHEIIKRSGVWPWLAKRAIRSETRRKMGLV